jgi:hypothetical protein
MPLVPLPSTFSSCEAKPFIPTAIYRVSSQAKDQNYPASKKQRSSLFKTEICKNWIENGYCRYAKKCQFAHGN